MVIVVDAVLILEGVDARVVGLGVCEVVVGGQHCVGVKPHRAEYVGEILGVIFLEHGAEPVFAEIAGVVEHDVKNYFHTTRMCGVDKILE